MKVGQCVRPKFSTQETKPVGWVTRVYHDGSFRVAYGYKGGRFTYPASSAHLFTVIA